MKKQKFQAKKVYVLFRKKILEVGKPSPEVLEAIFEHKEDAEKIGRQFFGDFRIEEHWYNTRKI